MLAEERKQLERSLGDAGRVQDLHGRETSWFQLPLWQSDFVKRDD